MSTPDSQPGPAAPRGRGDSDDQAANLQPLAGHVLPHTAAEDVLGVLTGTFMAALGLYLLEQSEAVSGGTAGLALLLTFGTPLNLGALFFLVNVPFFGLAMWRKGWRFTLRTALSVGVVSVFAAVCEQFMPVPDMNPVFGVFAGNVLIGVALLIVFRHGSSLGGFNILALIAQEQFNLRGGYVQMSLDVTVILLAFTVLTPENVLLSAAGAVIMNLILAFNHRPGRYRA
ncbi:YitT family protein [Nesterenkonia natronophila]|uniref:YitT family protein n=1 Tax=Nesterenkonia natronophila TaxID=2174932 RepID=A0A3A4F354_9MICC|nr:YitT family protein [Nesterenkonia natronophila]RJN32171.1 YitT family protein [Nesterenkonia natronophila]